jgi:hypothetical protein
MSLPQIELTDEIDAGAVECRGHATQIAVGDKIFAKIYLFPVRIGVVFRSGVSSEAHMKISASPSSSIGAGLGVRSVTKADPWLGASAAAATKRGVKVSCHGARPNNGAHARWLAAQPITLAALSTPAKAL